MRDDSADHRPGLDVVRQLVLVNLLADRPMVPFDEGVVRRRVRPDQRMPDLRFGQGPLAYAADQRDYFPANYTYTWDTAPIAQCGLEIVQGIRDTWVIALQASLGLNEPPFLRPLACPLALTEWPAELAEMPVPPNQPGSAWILNSYCCGRMVGSIPAAADGVLVFEHGFWNKMSTHTAQLAFPGKPYLYPHPAVTPEYHIERWAWPFKSHRQNIAWCDGHVSPVKAGQWPWADFNTDPHRIRHMRFNLPGTQPGDP